LDHGVSLCSFEELLGSVGVVVEGSGPKLDERMIKYHAYYRKIKSSEKFCEEEESSKVKTLDT
jgi:hypothetical protein